LLKTMTTSDDAIDIDQVIEATPYLLKFPYKKMWIDYDKEADVLYINFKRPQKATDSEMTKNGILLRYKGKELVGMTIMDASQRG
jgi:uncharacterized protein YuzE